MVVGWEREGGGIYDEGLGGLGRGVGGLCIAC